MTDSQDVFLPPYTHEMTGQLLGPDGRPIGQPVAYPAHSRIGLRVATVPTEPPVPPRNDWPEHAITPDDRDAVDINGNLRQWLDNHRGTHNKLLILNDTTELNQLCREDPALLADHAFTLKPDEFYAHGLTVNLGGQSAPIGPTFQGFTGVPSSGGYHARHTGRGKYTYRLCKMRGGYKGISSTGPESDTVIQVEYCEISGMSGKACAGLYHARGVLGVVESCIYEIGHLRGEPRSPREEAQLNHLIYPQWDCVTHIVNTFGDTSDSHAVQFRGGGSVNGLIANRTANGILAGHDKANRPLVSVDINRTIIVNTEDIDPERQRTGVGINTERANVKITNSIIADEQSAGLGSAFKPSHDSRLELDNVRVQGISRLFDVDGYNVSAVGSALWKEQHNLDAIYTNARKDANRQRYSVEGIRTDVQRLGTPVNLPDFDNMTPPEPGKIGELIDSIL